MIVMNIEYPILVQGTSLVNWFRTPSVITMAAAQQANTSRLNTITQDNVTEIHFGNCHELNNNEMD